LWEAPVFSERTSVGLDVHAGSIVAAAIDGDTGELFKERLVPSKDAVVSWVGPAAVTYEAARPASDWRAR
jgi:transposase